MSDKEQPQTFSTVALNGESTIKKSLERLALVRTAFSSERSVMAWIRTSVSLYSLGFSITKFFDYLEQQQEGLQFSAGPRRLGLVLICSGILALMLAVAEHMQRLQIMKGLGLQVTPRFSLPVSTAAALLAIGIVVIIGIAMHGAQ